MLPDKAKETAKTLIAYYNVTNPKEPLILIDPSELIDTNNLYICLYDGNQIGLFTRKKLQSEVVKKEKRSGYNTLSFLECTYYYYEADIYVGYYDESIIGINVLHRNQFAVNEWRESGYETTEMTYDIPYYKSSCHMIRATNFNKLREKLIRNGTLKYCLIGKTNEEEIEIILEYAKEYFGLNTPKERKRKQ